MVQLSSYPALILIYSWSVSFNETPQCQRWLSEKHTPLTLQCYFLWIQLYIWRLHYVSHSHRLPATERAHDISTMTQLFISSVLGEDPTQQRSAGTFGCMKLKEGDFCGGEASDMIPFVADDVWCKVDDTRRCASMYMNCFYIIRQIYIGM